MTLDNVVIAGGGQAGFQTAAQLRQLRFTGEILLVCDEACLPYQRPPLSKTFILGDGRIDPLLFRPARFFDDNRLEIVRGRMHHIDRAGQRIVLSDDRSIPYDHLVLAVGAVNRPFAVEGADLAGVHNLRTLEDAQGIGRQLMDARNIVVIGAGFIGMEFAVAARSQGAAVTVVDIADRPMARALSREMSALFTRAHSASGIEFAFGRTVTRVDGADGQVVAVRLDDGTRLSADLVVVGIGVMPNIDAASACGLEIDNGIKVDRHLVTSDPAISAIGDCASFPHATTGRRVRLESVQNATDQARTVASRLTGQPEPYMALPWFWSDQGALKLQIAGLIAAYDATVVVGDPEAQAISVLCFLDEQLVGVEAVNRPADYMSARRLLSRPPGSLSRTHAAVFDYDLKRWEVGTRT